MLQRRVDMIVPMQQELNPNSYGVQMQEFAVELTDCYSCLFDLQLEDLQSGRVKKSKKAYEKLNKQARLCIENTKYVTDIVYKSDDKFDYLQAVLNMELQSATKWTKIIEGDMKSMLKNMQESLDCYERSRKFVNDYKKDKGFTSDEQLTKDQLT